MSIFPKSFNTISSVTVTNSKTLINKYKDLLFDTTTKKVIVKDGKTEFTDKKKASTAMDISFTSYRNGEI